MKIALGDGVRFLRFNNLKRKSRNRTLTPLRLLSTPDGAYMHGGLFSRSIRLGASAILLILATSSLSQNALAQTTTTTTIVPPPPKQSGATQSELDPEMAYNSETGRNYVWDRDQKSWVDPKTLQPAPGRFQGKLDSDGQIIPPPPKQSGATQSELDPEMAYNSETGRNYVWDRDQKSWVDSKTLQPAPGRFQGKLVTGVPIYVDILKADASTAGVPKPSEETQKVEEKKQPSWWESLIPSFSIGVGGMGGTKEGGPRNPCSGKK